MTPRKPQYNDYSEIATLIRTTLEPLISKLGSLENKVDRLEGKVDVLSQDRVTRTDLDKMRAELHTTFVARDVYDARHSALISKDLQLESDLKSLDTDMQSQMQKLHERLESGKQQIEARFKDQQEAELSSRDRNWIRWTQALGFVSVIITVIGLLYEVAQHLSFR